MCEPVTLGVAATSTLSATGAAALTTAGLSAASTAGATLLATVPGAFVTTAASSGLFGAAGAFSWGSTLSTLSTFSSGLGALYSGATASANAKYQANMYEYQAQVDENNAIMAERASEQKADIFDEKLRRLMGTQAVKTAKSGTVINQDTPLEVAVNTAAEGSAERLAILYRGDVQAYAHRAGAKGQQFAAQNARDNATRAETGSYINAATQIGNGAYKGGLLA